jgi:hypothetical protein
MTGKAEAVLRKLRQRQALRRLNNPERRNRILEQFNRDNLDDVAPIGGAEQGMKLLSEMNSLTDDHDQYVKSLMPTVKVV